MAQLFLDSSGSWLNAFLRSPDGQIFWRGQKRQPGQRETLFPLVESLFHQASLKPAALSVLGVVIGPGSFTGLRTSLAGAMAMAKGTGAKMFGASSFEAAMGLLPEAGWQKLHVCQPALRQEVMWAQIERQGGEVRPVMMAEDLFLKGPQWQPQADEVFIGESLPQMPWLGISPLNFRHGVQALSPGLAELYRRGQLQPLESLSPTYHRPSDAEADRGVANTFPNVDVFGP